MQQTAAGPSEKVQRVSNGHPSYRVSVVIVSENCCTRLLINSGGDDSVTLSSMETYDVDVSMRPQQGNEAKVGVSQDPGG